MLEFSHKPVMLEECMEGLNLKDGGVYFDGTVGGGGHVVTERRKRGIYSRHCRRVYQPALRAFLRF